MKQLGMLFILILMLWSISALPIVKSTDSEHKDVDIRYLGGHMGDFCGQSVSTKGIVVYLISFYMFEDFWLNGAIPVVVRFAGLQRPPANSSIEISGVIEHSELEGGFYYLNAQSWNFAEISAPHLPEFSLFLLLPIFMMITLLAALVHKRRQNKSPTFG